MVSPLDFFDALFGDVVDDTHEIVLFANSRGGRQCVWCPTTEEAANKATALRNEYDVYFGASLQDREAVLKQATNLAATRGFSSTSHAIGGVWADIDVATGDHKKDGYAPSVDAVRTVLADLPLKPSLELFTGGGVHWWWQFHEPWVFDGQGDRDLAARSVQGWQGLIRDVSGFTLDSTHDLARVLRIPGTLNHKYGSEVRVMASSDVRYNPSDFEAYRSATVDLLSSRSNLGAGLELLPEAIPHGKFFLLLDQDPKLKATWDRKRRDLKDNSQSSYDMALAGLLVHWGFTDQEVVDVLIAHRRLGGERVEKTLRQDYYGRTLALARRSRKESEKAKLREDQLTDLEVAICEAVDEPVKEASEDPPDPEGERRKLLDMVGGRLGIDIERFVKFDGDEPLFAFMLRDGRTIHLGGAAALATFGSVKNAVLAHTHQVLEPLKRERWEPVLKALMLCVEVLDTGVAGHPARIVETVIANYLERQGARLSRIPADAASKQDARGGPCSMKQPFVEGDHVYLFLEPLYGPSQDLPLPPARALGPLLVSAGWESVIVGYRHGGKSSTRHAYRKRETALMGSACVD